MAKEEGSATPKRRDKDKNPYRTSRARAISAAEAGLKGDEDWAESFYGGPSPLEMEAGPERDAKIRETKLHARATRERTRRRGSEEQAAEDVEAFTPEDEPLDVAAAPKVAAPKYFKGKGDFEYLHDPETGAFTITSAPENYAHLKGKNVTSGKAYDSIMAEMETGQSLYKKDESAAEPAPEPAPEAAPLEPPAAEQYYGEVPEWAAPTPAGQWETGETDAGSLYEQERERLARKAAGPHIPRYDVDDPYGLGVGGIESYSGTADKPKGIDSPGNIDNPYGGMGGRDYTGFWG